MLNLDNVRVNDLIIGNVSSLYDQITLNREGTYIRDKRFPFCINLSCKKETIPDGIAYIQERFAKKPDYQPNETLKSILLSYFGNDSKPKLVEAGWNPKTLLNNEPTDLWEEIKNQFSNTDEDKACYEALLHPLKRGTSIQITYKEWFHSFVWENHGHMSRYALNLYKLMMENKIKMPRQDANQYENALNQTITIDQETRLITALTPAPADPVKAAPKKKPEPNPVGEAATTGTTTVLPPPTAPVAIAPAVAVGPVTAEETPPWARTQDEMQAVHEAHEAARINT